MLASRDCVEYNKRMTKLSLLSMILLSGVGAMVQEAAGATAGVPQTVDARLAQVLDAMVKTNDEDFYEAARVVLEGTGDETALLPMMQAAAKQGNAAAITWVCMYNIPFVSNDKAAFKRLLDKLKVAAEAKYVPAMVLLSQMSLAEQENEAKAWLMEACKSGNRKARALYLLQSGRLEPSKLNAPEVVSELKKGNYYLEELVAGAQTSEAEAMRWMLLAEEHGSNTAPYLLSQTEKNPAKAARHLQLAVERHNVMAMYLYGVLLQRADSLDVSQQLGLKPNAQEAYKNLAIAAMLSSPEAASAIAMAYANGELKDAPPERIYRLFEYAHKCGLAEGSAGVGYCMVLGVGCKRDEEQGMSMLKVARDRGALWVNQALASIYFNGAGSIKPDMRKALDALSDDAASGSVYAYAIMAGIAALGNESAKPDTSAAEVYMSFAKAINPRVDAQTNIRVAEHADKTYKAIVTSKSWCFFPKLVKSSR